MNITKTKYGKYRIRHTHNHKNYSINLDYKPSQREAYALITERISKAEVNIRKITLANACDEYINAKDQTLSASTIKNYKVLTKQLKRDYKIMKYCISDIDDFTLQKFINEYSKNHSPKTVRNTYGFFRVVIRLFRKGFNPEVTLPQKIKYEPYIPVDADIKKMLDFVKGTEYEVVIKLGLNGLRMSEALALTMNDIKDGEIRINKAKVRGEYGMVVKTTKTVASTRTIQVSKSLTDLIKSKGYVTKCAPSSIENFLKRNYKKYSKEYFSFHKLRHYWTSKMAPNVPLQYLMAMGGWESDSTPRKIYRHALKDQNYGQANIDYFDSLEK